MRWTLFLLGKRGKHMTRLSVAAALVTLATHRGRAAQPIRRVRSRMVVPFPAGGATRCSRGSAEHMRESLGQPRGRREVPGAGGSIGVGRMTRAAPDGYSSASQFGRSHVGAGAALPVQYDI